MVAVMPYIPQKPYDKGLEILTGAAKKVCQEQDDDFLVISTGPTGCGKSSLMMFAYEEYDKEASIDFIALNRQDHATALKMAKEKKGLRFCADDEANISRRDAMTRYNKDRIALYYAIRGLNIFHWWNNPSLEMIDKPFIEERLNGVLFIPSKKFSPRIYYYFRKEDILRLLEKHGNLKQRTLKKYAKEYAFFRGWFRKYDGKLWQPYQDKKGERMESSVDNFYEAYGTESFNASAAAKKLGITQVTMSKYLKMAVEKEIIPETARTIAGHWRLTEQDINNISAMPKYG